jgi:hypothetical protein
VGKEKQIRIIASAVIRRVLEEHATARTKGVVRAVDAAYPFGQRRGRAYLIWRDEARRALAEPGNNPVVAA